MVALLGASSISCVSYSSIQKADKEIYLSGATNYWVFTQPVLKRCDVDGQVLHCEELKEFEAGRKATAAPAATAETPAKPAETKPAEPAKK